MLKTEVVPAGGITLVWNQRTLVSCGMMPAPPRISGATHPAAPSMAQRPLMISPYCSHSGVMKPPAPSGSERPARGAP